jgi:DNA-3-methyladenine glycosylase II
MLEKAKPILRQDEQLWPSVSNLSLPPLRINQDLYQGLIRSVVYQQLSGKAAGTIHGRFLELFEDGYPHPEQVLGFEEEELRAVGLSRQKAGYIQNVARFFTTHDTTELVQLEDEALIKELTQIKGIGKWTVQMILLFNLGRPDVFPPDDLGIQKAMQQIYGLDMRGRQLKQAMLAIAENWQPYRSVATRLLWRYLD